MIIFRILLASLCVLSIALSNEKIEINAKNFKADRENGVTLFSGGVIIKRDRDELRSEELKVLFDKDSKPIEYEASGGVTINLSLDDRSYKGAANSALYIVESDFYLLKGNVQIRDSDNNSVEGDSIKLYRADGRLEVDGDELKPAKFIFTIDR